MENETEIRINLLKVPNIEDDEEIRDDLDFRISSNILLTGYKYIVL